MKKIAVLFALLPAIFLCGCHSFPSIPTARVLEAGECMDTFKGQVDAEYFTGTNISANETVLGGCFTATARYGVGGGFEWAYEIGFPFLGADVKRGIINTPVFAASADLSGDVSLLGSARVKGALLTTEDIGGFMSLTQSIGATALLSGMNGPGGINTLQSIPVFFEPGFGQYLDLGLVLTFYIPRGQEGDRKYVNWGLSLAFFYEKEVTGKNTQVFMPAIMVSSKYTK